MSLNRTALRMATVQMLANGFASPWPTLAQGRVFDSRIDAIQIGAAGELLPVITVCTDEETGEPLSTNNGGPPFEGAVTLSIDIAIGIATGDGDVAFAATEAELELNLDILEGQVRRLLVSRPGVFGRHFDKIARRITDFTSQRFVQPDANIRIAARQLTMRVMLPVEHVFTTAPVDYISPLLEDIVENVPGLADDAQTMLDAIDGSGIITPVVLPSFERLRIIEDERDSQNRPTTNRPDGVADIEFTPTA